MSTERTQLQNFPGFMITLLFEHVHTQSYRGFALSHNFFGFSFCLETIFYMNTCEYTEPHNIIDKKLNR